MTEREKSIYMAGFFDGEGYIGLLKRRRGKYIEHFIQLSIGQNDGGTMDWVKDNFGGHLHLVKRDGSYYWIASNKNAHLVLKRILPFLKYKKPQAELAIEFIEKRSKTRRISEEEITRRDDIFKRLKALKRVFVKSTYCIEMRGNND